MGLTIYDFQSQGLTLSNSFKSGKTYTLEFSKVQQILIQMKSTISLSVICVCSSSGTLGKTEKEKMKLYGHPLSPFSRVVEVN